MARTRGIKREGKAASQQTLLYLKLEDVLLPRRYILSLTMGTYRYVSSDDSDGDPDSGTESESVEHPVIITWAEKIKRDILIELDDVLNGPS